LIRARIELIRVKRSGGGGADVAEIAVALVGGGYGLVDILAGNAFAAPFLGPEEESFLFVLL